MNRKLYREVAKRHGVSVEEVKKDMQAAVDHAYEKPSLRNLHTQGVFPEGEKPTVDEFIAHATRVVKARI